MDAQRMLTAVWEFANSPAGLAILATLLAWLTKRLWTAKPTWEKYKGILCEAVAYAEKAIPDDTPSKSAARLDAALKYALVLIEQSQKIKIAEGSSLAESLKEGIRVLHAPQTAGIREEA